MPKTSLQKHFEEMRKPQPKVNIVTMILRGYLNAAGLTSSDVGPKLGISASGFRAMMGRKQEAWTIGDIEKVCRVLDIPSCTIYKALAANEPG